MSAIETLRASTTIAPTDHESKRIIQAITGLFLSIQLSNPDYDIDWSTVDISTETDTIDEASFADEKWLIHETKRLYVEVKGVLTDG